jgi:hypothetical protein
MRVCAARRSERFGVEFKEPSRVREARKQLPAAVARLRASRAPGADAWLCSRGQNPLDCALGDGRRGGRGGERERGGRSGGGGGERLSRLELMKQRREAAQRNGFATGFDVTSPEERRKREERAGRYKDQLGFSALPPDPEAAAAAAAAAAEAAAKRAARAAKFGADAALAAAGGPSMEDVDFLEPRAEAAPDAPVRLDCVYLYGVDTMSTAECMSYFREYGPVFCEWINDSSCNIVFADAFTAKRAMVAVGTVIEEEDAMVAAPHAADAEAAPPVPAAAEAGDGMDDSAEGAAAAAAATAKADDVEARKWYAGPAFEKDGVSIPLCFRLATEADVKPDGRVQSRWLWCGGAPPKRVRAAAATRAQGKRSAKRRRRARDEGDDEGEDADGDMDFDADKAEGDLREALKRRRAEAPPAAEGQGDAAAAEAQPGAADGEDAMVEAAEAPVQPVPLEQLPAGDLRVALANTVPDFGDDGE